MYEVIKPYCWILVFILKVFIGGESVAQISIENSTEIVVGVNERAYQLLTVGAHGIMLYRDFTPLEVTTQRTWDLTFLNPDLEIQWQTIIQSDINFLIVAACAEEQFIYFLFHNQNTSEKEVEIFRLDIITKQFVRLKINTFVPAKIDYFRVVNHTVILGGREKGKPAYVFYPQFSERPVILQGIYGRKGKVLDVFHDKANQVCTILYRYRNSDGNKSIAIKSYDYNGKLVEDNSIEPKVYCQFEDGRTHILGNKRIVAGIYIERGSLAPNGIFISVIDPRGTFNVNYYPYDRQGEPITNIPDSLIENDPRYLENIPRNNEHALVREFYKMSGQLFLLTEIIHPNDMNSKTRENSGGMVRFIKGNITSIDGKGDINWYTQFMLSGFYTNLQPAQTQLWQIEDTTQFFFHNKGFLEAKKILNGEFISEFLNVNLGLEEDTAPDDINGILSTNELLHWYGPYYIFFRLKSNHGSVHNTKVMSLRKLKVANINP